MKKILFSLIFLIVIFIPINVSAASGSLTGPGTVRSGDTITLNFNIAGSNIFGASGTLSYDSSKLTFVSTSVKVGTPWAVEFNGGRFVAYDNNLSSPINGSRTLFSVTFKIKSVSPGDNINVSYTGVTTSDGSADSNVGTVSYSKSISAPLSGDNNLSSLNVSNAKISPSFSSNKTFYTTKVDYKISKLNLNYKSSDKDAKVSISGNSLKAGGTTNVNITVTAANGSKKTYTIKVTRAQDPNYVKSSNNLLKELSVDRFLLSPQFKSDLYSYIVWVPYEVDEVKVSATKKHKLAKTKINYPNKLLAGRDNPIEVVVTAENGKKQVYTVIIKRAAAHDGKVDDVVIEKVEKVEDVNETNKEVNFISYIIISLVSLVIGIGATILFFKRNVIITKFKKSNNNEISKKSNNNEISKKSKKSKK